MRFLLNGIGFFAFFCCFLIVFTVNDLVAAPLSKNAKSAIVFIKKDPGINISQPVTIRISPGETIYYDDRFVTRMEHSGPSNSVGFSFPSGHSVYTFFLTADNHVPEIENADDYYVFYVAGHVQEPVSEDDSDEDDELINTLETVHSVVYVYENNQWVEFENHVVDRELSTEYDEIEGYLNTAFSQTQWIEDYGARLVNYVKHRVGNSGKERKTNKPLKQDSEEYAHGFIIIDPDDCSEASAEGLPDDEPYYHWTSWSAAPLKLEDAPSVEPGNPSLLEFPAMPAMNDSITDSMLFGGGGRSYDRHPVQVTNNQTLVNSFHNLQVNGLPPPVVFDHGDCARAVILPGYGWGDNPQSAFTRQSPQGWTQQVAEPEISRPFPGSVMMEQGQGSNFLSKNNSPLRYGEQRVAIHQALIQSQVAHQNGRELLIANPFSQSQLEERMAKLEKLPVQGSLTLGRRSYTLTHNIAMSSEGPVRLGRDTNKKYVAIKTIYNPQGYSRDQSECRGTALLQSGQLEHPFTISFIEICQVGDYEYQVMPYLPYTLSEVRGQQQDDYWTVEKTWLVLKQLLTVVSFYHKNSITHRDIKPANIMVSMDGTRIQVTDFGTAKKVGPSGMSQSIIGTLEYLTPAHASAFELRGLVNHYYADLAAVALTLINLEINKTLFTRNGANGLTHRELFNLLQQQLSEFGWSYDSSAQQVSAALSKLFREKGRAADDRLLKLLAKMLTATTASQEKASELLAEYFPAKIPEEKGRKIVEAPYQKIQNLFFERGIAVENVPADGNCLYASIARSMINSLLEEEYNYISNRLPRVVVTEGGRAEEGGREITVQRIRHYLHNLLNRMLLAINEVSDAAERDQYRSQLSLLLGEEYQTLSDMIVHGRIICSADHAGQTLLWGDGYMVSSLLALGFGLRLEILTAPDIAYGLPSFDRIKEDYPGLVSLLQDRSIIPTYYRAEWSQPVRVVYADGNHYLAASPLPRQEKKALEWRSKEKLSGVPRPF